jgi:hypothetical protein
MPDGPVVCLSYPVVTIERGQNLARMKAAGEVAAVWLDYVSELASESRADPAREAMAGLIGIHPFVIGTSDDTAALRRCGVFPGASRRMTRSG